MITWFRLCLRDYGFFLIKKKIIFVCTAFIPGMHWENDLAGSTRPAGWLQRWGKICKIRTKLVRKWRYKSFHHLYDRASEYGFIVWYVPYLGQQAQWRNHNRERIPCSVSGCPLRLRSIGVEFNFEYNVSVLLRPFLGVVFPLCVAECLVFRDKAIQAHSKNCKIRLSPWCSMSRLSRPSKR